MKQILFFIVGLLYSIAVSAQVRLNALTAGKDFSFPIVEVDDSAAAQKINDYLQTNVLENTSRRHPGSTIFDRTRYSPGESGYTSLDYTEELNDGRVVSFRIHAETMGAYPDQFTGFFNFNSQNGELILVQDIFTADGLTQLGRLLRAKRAAIIRQYIKESAGDTTVDIAWLRETLETCNQQAEQDRFLIRKSTLLFQKTFCFPHKDRPWETNLDIELPYDGLESWLSPFGKKLLFQKAQSLKDDVLPGWQKPFYGTAADQPVVIQFTWISDQEWSGFYYEPSNGDCVMLDGQLTNNQLVLYEHNNEGRSTAVWKLNLETTRLSGLRKDLQTGQQEAVAVENGRK